jgi:glutamate-1-semialdehyde 2,1-aminomutase
MAIEQLISPGDRSVEMVGRVKRSVAGGDSTYSDPGTGQALAVRRAEDATLWDQDGNSYLDYCLGRGSLLLGHTPVDVIDGVHEQLTERGVHFCLPHRLEVKVGEALQQLVPCVDLVRFTCSGTEAVMGAVRLARASTGREKIVKCEGAYHGWGDLEFASVWPSDDGDLGPADAPRTVLQSQGIPASVADTIVVIPFNDADALSRVLEDRAHEIAAVVIEPVLAQCGIVPPDDGYLQEVRRLTLEHGVMLIFDEVSTGFRLAAGGAQQYYRVIPDLCVLGGAMGGGFPVACFGGPADVMQLVVDKTVLLGGIHAGAPLALSGADKVLDRIRRDTDPSAPYPVDHDAVYAGAGKGPGEKKVFPGGPPGTLYTRLFELGDRLRTGLAAIFSDAGLSCVDQGVGPMFSVYLGDGDVRELRNYRQVREFARVDLYASWQAEMQKRGVYLHPHQFQPMFVSLAHTDDDIDRTLAASEGSVAEIARRL